MVLLSAMYELNFDAETCGEALECAKHCKPFATIIDGKHTPWLQTLVDVCAECDVRIAVKESETDAVLISNNMYDCNEYTEVNNLDQAVKCIASMIGNIDLIEEVR